MSADFKGLSRSQILTVDAATCIAMATLLLSTYQWTSAWTGIPDFVLYYAGLSLVPIAIFIGFTAYRRPWGDLMIWAIIAGNVAWAFGSLYVATLFPTINAIGMLFIVAQASVVAVLAAVEWRMIQIPVSTAA